MWWLLIIAVLLIGLAIMAFAIEGYGEEEIELRKQFEDLEKRANVREQELTRSLTYCQEQNNSLSGELKSAYKEIVGLNEGIKQRDEYLIQRHRSDQHSAQGL